MNGLILIERLLKRQPDLRGTIVLLIEPLVKDELEESSRACPTNLGGFPSLTSVARPRRISAPPNRKGNPVRYNIDLDLNPGLPSIISEYYGPHSFFDAKQTALARLYEWREESLAQIQEECPSAGFEEWRQAVEEVYKDHHQTVSNWCRRDVDRKEQDAIAGPLSALMQVLPRNRRQAVFAEIMQAVCSLDSADLQRLSDLIAKMSAADSDAQSEADYEI
jgi:hypothetical protein